MLHQRIGVFAALPIRSLDRLTLQAKLQEIGRMSGRDSQRADLMPSPAQRVVAEALGTAFLLAAVVGSGIMAQRLAGGNVALALLCNTLPTGAILAVLILIFGPVSGAHFNPAVTLAFALRGETAVAHGGLYLAAQVVGGDRRRLGRAPDVRAAGLAALDPRPHRARASGSPKPSRPSACC